MLTTRTHHLDDPVASTEVDGSVVLSASDRIVRSAMSGRHKGAIEHTLLRFQFVDRTAALAWLNAARKALDAAR